MSFGRLYKTQIWGPGARETAGDKTVIVLVQWSHNAVWLQTKPRSWGRRLFHSPNSVTANGVRRNCWELQRRVLCRAGNQRPTAPSRWRWDPLVHTVQGQSQLLWPRGLWFSTFFKNTQIEIKACWNCSQDPRRGQSKGRVQVLKLHHLTVKPQGWLDVGTHREWLRCTFKMKGTSPTSLFNSSWTFGSKSCTANLEHHGL